MRLQVAFDYLMVFTFVLLVFTMLFASIAKQRVEFSSEQSFAQLQVVAQTIASEISDAGQGGNGYTATFYLPSGLSILQYNVSLTKYGSVIVSSDQFGQKVQAVAFGGQYNILSSPSYLVAPSNTYYTIPTYNGTGSITFQNSLGTICIDYGCPTSANQVAQLTVGQQVTWAVGLNGKTSYVNYQNGNIFNVQPPLSMSLWFMPTNSLVGSNLYSVASKSGSGEDFDLQFTGNVPYFYLCTTITGCINLHDPNPINDGVWHNAVITYDGTTLSFYLDGSLVASRAVSGNRVTTEDSFCIGQSCWWTGRYFPGEVTNVQIYTSALTSQQVDALYSNGISGPPVNTLSIGFWSLMNGNFNDYSGNGYTGQPYGTVTYPTVAQISATVTNDTGNSIADALVGFATSNGNFTNGPSTSNFTNSNGNAYAFMSQLKTNGLATVKSTAFNGNSSTTANLIAWFPMNLGQGSSVYDVGALSGNPNSNYLFGNIIGSSWASPNYAAHFDGQSSYIQIPSATALQLSQLTINAWVNASGSGLGHFGWIMGRYGAYGLGVCGASLLVCYFDYGGTGEHDSVASLLPNTWYMLTAVISSSGLSGGTETLYVNGVQVLSGSLTINTQQNAFQIGSSALPQNTVSQIFNGSISNVQLYSAALTQNQINEIYSMGIGGNPLPSQIIGWWPLNGDAFDYSGNGYNGTIYGALQMVPLAGISGQFGSSHLLYASFNGVNSYVQASNITSFQTPSNTITITGWANYAAASAGHIGWLVAKVNAYGIGTCGPLLVVCYYDWGGTGEHDSSTSLSPNTWYMLSAVINGTTNIEKVYVNGAKVLSGHLSIASTANALDIGYGACCSQYMDGGASNIQIYGGSLTQSQIQQLYQQGISATPLLGASILSWFPLNGDTSDYSNPNDQGVPSNILYYAQNVNPPYWTPSISGYGAFINGIGGGATMNEPPQKESSSAVSVSAWVYPVSYTNNGSGAQIVASDWTTGSPGPFSLELTKSNMPSMMGVSASSHIGGSTYSVSTSSPNVPINSWSMLTFVYNGTYLNLYVNGILSASNGPNTGTLATPSDPMTIGYEPFSPYDYFNGTVADVQVYNSALSKGQISQLYNAGLPISQTSTVPLGGVT